MIEPVLSFEALGLVYDVAGVIALGFAFLSKNIKTVKSESATRGDYNLDLAESVVTTRTDGIFGSLLLISGFMSQFAALFHVSSPTLVAVGYALLGGINILFWAWLRSFLVAKQCAQVRALHKKS